MSEMTGNELLVVAAIRDELSVGLTRIREELGGVAKAQTEVGASSTVAAAGLDRTGVAAETTTRRLTAADLANRNAASSFRTLGMTVPKTAAALAVVAAGAVYMAAKFEASMARVNTQAGASLAEVHRMSAALIAMAPSVGVGPDKLADSLYHVESAGFRSSQALDMVRAAAKGAAIGNADLGAVTQAMIASIASGIKGVRGADDAMALLNRTVGIGDMKMQALAQAMATGILPSARSAGLSFEDVAASLATITDNATPANEAATRLRMTFALMSAPTGRAVAALGSIGMSSTQLATDMRKPQGLLVALTDLQAHLHASGKTAVQQNAVIEHAFGGGRTSGAILTLLLELDRLRSKYQELGTSAERQAEFQAAWAETTSTLTYKWHAFVAGLESAGISIGQRLTPAVKGLLDLLTGTVGGVAHLTGAIAGNRSAVILLAAALTLMLLPAIIRTATAMATVGFEKVAMGVYSMTYALSGLGAGALAFGAAGVAIAGAFVLIERSAAAAKGRADDFVQGLDTQKNSLVSYHSSIASIDSRLGSLKAAAAARGSLSHASGWNIFTNGDLPWQGGSGKQARTGGAEGTELAKQRDQLLAQAGRITQNEAALQSAYGMTGQQVETLANRYGIDLSGSLAKVQVAFDNELLAARQSRDVNGRAAADIADMASSATTAAQAVTDLKDSLDALSGNAIAADEAAITFRDRIVTLEKALKTSHGSMSMHNTSTRAARQAFDEAISGASQWAVAVQQSTGSTDKSAAALQTAIAFLTPFAKHNKDAAAQVAALKHELDLLQGRIDALHGKHVVITVGSPGAGVHLPGTTGRAMINDTPGPRAAGGFGSAMAFHAGIDGGLSGKRTVTSSTRSWGLGSPWSDHATGRAIDLIGSGLVGYAEAARRAGAFAEFHGAGAGRHLHVAAGDTPGPRSPGGGIGPAGGGGMMLVVQITEGAVVVGAGVQSGHVEEAVARGAARGARRAIERARVHPSTFGAH